VACPDSKWFTFNCGDKNIFVFLLENGEFCIKEKYGFMQQRKLENLI